MPRPFVKIARTGIILWFWRVVTLLFTAGMIYDITNDRSIGPWLRLGTLGSLVIVMGLVFIWQLVIAHRYDGIPAIPLSFRWVMAIWFCSLSLFCLWAISTTFYDPLTEYWVIAFMYWQVFTATTWFASRWTTIEAPHHAGIGETGTQGGHHG